MSEEAVVPNQWDESEYNPFPSFIDWAPSDYDSGLVDRYEQQLRALRARVSEADLDRALGVVNRYAAIDTGAIEGLYKVDRGFTKTVATQTASWENALNLKGEEVKRAIDDALHAYEYVLDAVTGAVDITEVWIRQLHEIICASQVSYTVQTSIGPQEQELPKGVYKIMPNSPTNASTGRTHAYAPPSLTPAEMARLVQEFRTPEFRSAHPVVQAAYAHYAYVAIHPFSDGNGRIARALASVYLYRSPGVPLVVFADQRDQYLDALEAADRGDSRPFVRFVETRTLDAVSLLEASLNSEVWELEDDLAQLRLALEEGETSAVLLDGADRLKSLAKHAMSDALEAISLPASVRTWVIDTGALSPVIPEGWRAVGSRERFRVNLESEFPVTVQTTAMFEILVTTGGINAEFALKADSSPELVEIWLRDVHPLETESVRLRVTLWAERMARQLVHAFSEQVRLQN